MPMNFQNWPFLNWTQLGLDRDMPVCDYFRPWSSLLNRHGRVVHLCESHERINFVRWPVFSVFGLFLVPFTLLFSPKYKTRN
ncbi:Mucin-16 [Gossypium arboreum]|uniref:Mucin-16 n=1 Tax=Gossypium arboreum TaxID=29729 RepID=A0A0B0PLQ9_GOSAR|nr:Mucin-16 [Gossypium arboreum]